MKKHAFPLCCAGALVLISSFSVLCFWLSWYTSMSGFVGLRNYIRLFMDDSVMMTALRNTLLLPLAACALSFAVLCIVQAVMDRRGANQKVRLIFLITAPVILVLTCYVPLRVAAVSAFGMPSVNYAADTIVWHLVDYGRAPLFDLPTLLFSAWIAALLCLLLWFSGKIDAAVRRMIKKRKGRDCAD